MTLTKTDLRTTVEKYLTERTPTHRYASFDYCYNYFHPSNRSDTDVEQGCYALGFYLASWGMMRGSSFLLQKSVKHFEATVQYIAKCDPKLWNIDADNYTDANSIGVIVNTFKDIRGTLEAEGHQDVTLVTKVLLGVFGFVPAFDQNFCETFGDIFEQCGFRRLNAKVLQCIQEFYTANKQEIDTLSRKIKTLDFKTGKETKLHYPKAKIIDMYGFQKSLPKQK
jgi:hypothetical protein